MCATSRAPAQKRANACGIKPDGTTLLSLVWWRRAVLPHPVCFFLVKIPVSSFARRSLFPEFFVCFFYSTTHILSKTCF